MIATMAGPLHRSRLPLMCRLLISSCLPWPWLAEIRQLGRWIEKEPVPVQTPPSVDCHVPCCRSSIPWEYGRQHQHQVPLAARRLQQQGADAFEGTGSGSMPRQVSAHGWPPDRASRSGQGKAGREAKPRRYVCRKSSAPAGHRMGYPARPAPYRARFVRLAISR